MLSRLLDLIAPRFCCMCGRRLDLQEEIICTGCFMVVPLSGYLDDLVENPMAQMFWGRISQFERAFALMRYEPMSSSINTIMQLKYYHRPDVGEALGLLMGKRLMETDFFDDIDALIPVPLARSRERERGYNQSVMIARGLQLACHKPIWNNVVVRPVATVSQTKKDRVERADNMAGAFRVRHGERLNGRHVVIVDDVVTTGATVCGVASVLQQAADVRISVVSLAFAGEK